MSNIAVNTEVEFDAFGAILDASLSKKEEAILKVRQKVEDRNKEFKNASEAKQRVMICEDVISAIKSKEIIIRRDAYLNNNELYGKLYELKEKTELRDILEDTSTPCEVCAKGALFVVEVLRRDNFSVNNGASISSSAMCRKMEEYFDRGQLDGIEAAFERDVIWDKNKILYTKTDKYGNSKLTTFAKKCVEFGKQFRSDTQRLLAILENIIDNKGTFKP